MVGPRDIELFTELTGDRNPLHYDAERASPARFGWDRRPGRRHQRCSTPSSRRSSPGPAACFCYVSLEFTAPVRPGDNDHRRGRGSRSVRADKPITELATRVLRADGTVVLEGIVAL